MIKIFQISSEINTGSVGRIAEQIGEQIIAKGWESYIAFGRDSLPSKSHTFQIGNKFDLISHVLRTRFTDRHGFGSNKATIELISKIDKIQPDLIQLQHMHGYFINIEILFNYLAKAKIPVVWTFHDCWSFTGHCAYYEFINCQKWQSACSNCPQLQEYPKSLFVDNSSRNFEDKKKLFNSVQNLSIVPVSNWLAGEVEKSFLKQKTIRTIYNGIDLHKFSKQHENIVFKDYKIKNKFIVLGVASPWTSRKGLTYFYQLSERLSSDYQIILIGLSEKQINEIPKNIIGVARTENIQQLAQYYSSADVFLNPTLDEALGLTNIEALACGTPVITFNSGGSPETIDEYTGIVVEKRSIEGLLYAIEIIRKNGKNSYTENCRLRAERHFDKNKNFKKYTDLYLNILEKGN